MSIEVMNTRKGQLIGAALVAVPLLGYFGYRAVEGVAHAYHQSQVHQGQNITYTVSDCQVAPTGDGSRWGATVVVHNGNGDQTAVYKVQVKFVQNGAPVAWSKVTDLGEMDPDSTKEVHAEANLNESGGVGVTCAAVFYRESWFGMGGNVNAGDESPVQVGK